MLNNIFIIKRNGKPICCPVCRKRDGKHYQVNHNEFRCCNCARKITFEKVKQDENM